MKHESLVNATDLDLWAERNESKALLAKLIRWLLQASGVKFKMIDFQSEEGIFSGGWDGFLDSPEGGTYFLRGLSGWEVSAQDGVTAKANKAYTTRTKNTKATDRRKTAFIFVTLRRWPGKSKWVTARNAERSWRKVVALDATDLEAWLETEPSVHQLLSERLGKWPEDVSSLDQTWRAWADVTKPVLSARLIQAGRKPQVESVAKRLDGSPHAISIKADTRDEAVAFFISVVNTLPDGGGERIASRALVVRSREAWEKLERSTTPLVLVALFNDRGGVGLATSKGHTVVVPMDRTDGPDQGSIVLASLDRGEAQQALLEMGCKAVHVRELARTARRSMMSLRRRLATDQALQNPEWSKSGSAPDLIPALLLGTWQDSSEGDQRAYARLAGVDYAEAQHRLMQWAQKPDPPIKLVGGIWFVVSPDDLWTLLSRHLTSAVIGNFENVAKDILCEAHPMYDLPAGERWFPHMRGKAPSYSNTLRHGVAENLAFMGAHGSSLPVVGGRTLSNLVEGIVWRVLEGASADWRIWATLGQSLCALAEAAPEQFLKGVGACLKKTPSVFAALFQSDEDPMFSVPKHTGLISALETLAWHPDHLAQVASTMADMVELDPITKQTPRPLASLCAILHPVLKNTEASADDRTTVLGALRSRKHRQAYPLLMAILPNDDFQHFNFTHEPRWRDWPHDRPDRFNNADGRESFKKIWDWILADTASEPDRCVLLAKSLRNVGRDQFFAGLEVLRLADRSQWSDDQKRLLWDELRDLHIQHENHREQVWAMPADMLNALAELVKQVEPSETLSKVRWVFDGAHQFPGESVEEYERVHAEVTSSAAQHILARTGVEGVKLLAQQVDDPWQLGNSVGTVIDDGTSETELLVWAAPASDEKTKRFGMSLISALFVRKGWDWAEMIFTTDFWGRWNSSERAVFLSSLSFTKRTWESAERSGRDVEAAYWKAVHPWGKPDEESMLYAAAKFMEHGKPLRALDNIFRHGKGENCTASSAVIADVLAACVKTYSEERRGGHSDYLITQAHKVLTQRMDVDPQRIALIEWTFFSLLERQKLVLYEEMAKDPAPFAEILVFMFKPVSEPDRRPTEQEAGLARRAYEVLKGWKGMPAMRPDGTIDGEELKKWYRDAKVAVEAKDRLWSDYLFGEKLRYAPKEADGTWPCLAVRELIEDLKSDALEQGVGIEVMNSRGVRAVDMGEGDRASSAYYARLAEEAALTYPRTAAMLRSIARSLEHDAQWEVERHETAQDLDFHV